MAFRPSLALSNLKLSHYGFILVAVPLIFEIIFVCMLNHALDQSELETKKEKHARVIVTHLSNVIRNLITSGEGMVSIFGQNVAFKHSSDVLPLEFKELEILAKDDPDILDKIHVVQQKVNYLHKSFREIKDQISAGDLVRATGLTKDTKKLLNEVNNSIQAIIDAQERVEAMSVETQDAQRRSTKVILLIGIGANILIAVLLVLVFNSNTSRRLNILMDNSVRLARGAPLHPPMEGSDEIATLDRVFTAMAEVLDDAARKERAVVENAMDMMCTINERGYLTKVSPSSLKLLGYPAEDLMAMSIREILAKEDTEPTMNLLSDIKCGKWDQPFEARLIRKEGSIIYTLWSAQYSLAENSFFCVVHDITERKQAEDLLRQAEARIRLIIESMPIGLVIIDSRGCIESINPMIEKMFEKSIEDLKDMSITELFVKPQAVSSREFALELIDKTQNHTKEYTGKKKDGATLPIEVALTGFETPEGMRHLVLLVDVTERHEVERLKQQFISMVSHELRSPLNSVLGFLEMLPEGVYGTLTPQGEDKTLVAQRNITRLMKLINDLLDIGRMEAGRLSMEMAETELLPVLQRSAESVKTLADKAQITIALPQTDAVVTADGDRLVQVLVNLIANAIKFSPPESTISVSVKPDGEWYEIRVTDQGRGIPAKDKDRIFEKFQQVTSSDARKLGGTGLGLAICKAIVEQHSGVIGVDSEEGKGSSFWFKLPAKVASLAPSA